MFPLRDNIVSRAPPIATIILIALNATAFFFEMTISDQARERLFYIFGLVPKRFSDQVWAESVGFPILPFLSSMFLHGGFFHIVLNMWMLWIFADNVEERMGSMRFVVFYILSGIVSGLCHVTFNPSSPIPAVGASGAIAGVMGAYAFMFPRSRIVVFLPLLFWPFFFEISAYAFMLVWFYGQLFSGLASLANPMSVGGIAWWAHIGGFLAGILLRPIFDLRLKYKNHYIDDSGIEWSWR